MTFSVAARIRGPSRSANLVAKDDRSLLLSNGDPGSSQIFTFDRVFGSGASQREVFASISPDLLRDFSEGVNVGVLVHGTSGAGKTYTLLGDSRSPDGDGLVPRMLSAMLQRCSQPGFGTCRLQFSFVAVHDKYALDLLAEHQRPLGIVKTDRGYEAEGVTKHLTTSNVIFTELVERGLRALVGPTPHLILTMHLTRTRNNQAVQSSCQFADLLSSTFPQAPSLTLLASCLRKIVEGQGEASFRDCYLTQLLKESLRGRVCVVVCVAPDKYLGSFQALSFFSTKRPLQHTFRFYRWRILRTSGNKQFVQVAYVKFLGPSNQAVAPVSVSSPSASGPSANGPMNVAKPSGLPWIDYSSKPELVFDFGSPVPLQGYEFFVSPEAPEGEPAAWELHASNDLKEWFVVDHQERVPQERVSRKRPSWAGSFTRPRTPFNGDGGVDDGMVSSSNGMLSSSSNGMVGSGSNGMVGSASGGSGSNRWYRWTVTAVQPGSRSSVQASRVAFYRGRERLWPLGVVEPEPSLQSPRALLEAGDNMDSKWVKLSSAASLIFDFGGEVALTAFEWFTAADFQYSDPAVWTLEGSADLSQWRKLAESPAVPPRCSSSGLYYLEEGKPTRHDRGELSNGTAAMVGARNDIDPQELARLQAANKALTEAAELATHTAQQATRQQRQAMADSEAASSALQNALETNIQLRRKAQSTLDQNQQLMELSQSQQQKILEHEARLTSAQEQSLRQPISELSNLILQFQVGLDKERGENGHNRKRHGALAPLPAEATPLQSLSHVHVFLSTLKEEWEQLIKQRDSLQQQLKAKTEEADTNKRSFEDCSAELAGLRRELQTGTELLSTEREAQTKAAADSHELRTVLSQEREQATKLKEELKQLQTGHDEWRVKCGELEAAVAQGANHAQTLAEIKALQKEREDAQQLQGQLQTQLMTLQAERDELANHKQIAIDELTKHKQAIESKQKELVVEPGVGALPPTERAFDARAHEMAAEDSRSQSASSSSRSVTASGHNASIHTPSALEMAEPISHRQPSQDAVQLGNLREEYEESKRKHTELGALVEALTGQLQQQSTHHQHQVETLKDQHLQQVDILKQISEAKIDSSRHKQEIERVTRALELQHAAQLSKWKEQFEVLTQQLEKQREHHRKQILELQREQQRQFEEVKRESESRSKSEQEAVRTQYLLELAKVRKDVMEEYENSQKQQMRQLTTEHESQLSAHKQQVELLSKQGELHISQRDLVNQKLGSLTAQLEALQTQHDSLQQQAQLKQSELASLQAQHKASLDLMKHLEQKSTSANQEASVRALPSGELHVELQQLKTELEEQHRREMESLKQQHAKDYAELKQQLELKASANGAAHGEIAALHQQVGEFEKQMKEFGKFQLRVQELEQERRQHALDAEQKQTKPHTNGVQRMIEEDEDVKKQAKNFQQRLLDAGEYVKGEQTEQLSGDAQQLLVERARQIATLEQQQQEAAEQMSALRHQHQVQQAELVLLRQQLNQTKPGDVQLLSSNSPNVSSSPLPEIMQDFLQRHPQEQHLQSDLQTLFDQLQDQETYQEQAHQQELENLTEEMHWKQIEHAQEIETLRMLIDAGPSNTASTSLDSSSSTTAVPVDRSLEDSGNEVRKLREEAETQKQYISQLELSKVQLESLTQQLEQQAADQEAKEDLEEQVESLEERVRQLTLQLEQRNLELATNGQSYATLAQEQQADFEKLRLQYANDLKLIEQKRLNEDLPGQREAGAERDFADLVRLALPGNDGNCNATTRRELVKRYDDHKRACDSEISQMRAILSMDSESAATTPELELSRLGKMKEALQALYREVGDGRLLRMDEIAEIESVYELIGGVHGRGAVSVSDTQQELAVLRAERARLQSYLDEVLRGVDGLQRVYLQQATEIQRFVAEAEQTSRRTRELEAELSRLVAKEPRRALEAFSDNEFPVGECLGAAVQGRVKVTFRRPRETTAKPILFDDIQPSDVRQGSLGDCWLMSSLSALAEFPELIKRVFKEMVTSEDGSYTCRLFDVENKQWMEIKIDDLLPYKPDGRLAFAQSENGELWPCLLEKAFAKWMGSYSALSGGWPALALEALTGCESLLYRFLGDEIRALSFRGLSLRQATRAGAKSYSTGHSWTKEQFFSQLQWCDEQGYIMTLASTGQDVYSEGQGPSDDFGIVGGHAYSLIAVRLCKGFRLCQVRNPWGDFEWGGDWSDQSDLWQKHPEVREELRPNLDKDDGLFWIPFTDLLRVFTSVTVNKTQQRT